MRSFLRLALSLIQAHFTKLESFIYLIQVLVFKAKNTWLNFMEIIDKCLYIRKTPKESMFYISKYKVIPNIKQSSTFLIEMICGKNVFILTQIYKLWGIWIAYDVCNGVLKQNQFSPSFCRSSYLDLADLFPNVHGLQSCSFYHFTHTTGKKGQVVGK